MDFLDRWTHFNFYLWNVSNAGRAIAQRITLTTHEGFFAVDAKMLHLYYGSAGYMNGSWVSHKQGWWCQCIFSQAGLQVRNLALQYHLYATAVHFFLLADIASSGDAFKKLLWYFCTAFSSWQSLHLVGGWAIDRASCFEQNALTHLELCWSCA